MLDLVTDFDKDATLTYDILHDPNHPVTVLMLQTYSMECFIYKSLNNASRYGDVSKIDSLGPYAQVMNAIVCITIKKRDEELDSS
jgi:hypothetical protein